MRVPEQILIVLEIDWLYVAPHIVWAFDEEHRPIVFLEHVERK
jgi:hypothetical protein